MELAKLVTGGQMEEIDRRTTVEAGIPGAVLMERAGRAVFDLIVEKWEGVEGLQAVVLCGKGNNGGDGFVVAWLMLEAGVPCRIFATVTPEQIEGDAAHHLGKLVAAGGAVETLGEDVVWGELEEALEGADLIVDALLGTGLRGPARPHMARLIETVNQADRPVVAVDVPSGMDADTGRIDGVCIHALMTATFGLAKIGQLFYPGRTCCGILHLLDIGFAPEVVATAPASAWLTTADWVAQHIPQRAGDVHKGRCGAVAVVAGSLGMTGAAALTADTALLAGAGQARLGAPASLNDILEVKLTEVMTRPLPEIRKHRCLALRALGPVRALLDRASCAVIGPGLGRHRETAELVRRLVAGLKVPAVIDADGLNAVAADPEVLRRCAAPLVLTPHLGEFARLTGLDKKALAAAPLENARRFARQFDLTLVLKGGPTLIAWPDGRVIVNPTGNPGMATAGSGDVLSGVIAALVAQGVAVPEAACLGVYLHGLAGDLERDRKGEWGLLAGDISRAVPGAILAALGGP
ncbi:MAG: NAD(P)H-hydrate dehydratase [Candidatus Latescibacteria bacterium]|nr:NAD(P)H-hydrate dehydratase [Candidatus Latescibacterota bacterium]